MNRNKKKAIVEWLNCISEDYPIECLSHLKDGDHFYNLAKKITKLKDDEQEADTEDDKYAYVLKCLNGFFEIDCAVLVDFEVCRSGSLLELGKVAILLLSALVHLYLTEKDERVFLLTQLEQHIQEDIQQCISSVLLSNNNAKITLSPDFASVLSEQTAYDDAYSTPKKPNLSSACQTPKGSRKRGRARRSVFVPPPPPPPADSPLKILLDSPQILNQVALRQRDIKLQKLQFRLTEEETKVCELESDKDALQNTVNRKDKEIAELKEKVLEFRKYRDLADELYANEQASNEEKAELSKLIDSRCVNCSSMKQTLEELDARHNKVDEQLWEKQSKLEGLQSANEKIMQECEEMRTKVKELEDSTETLRKMISDLEASLLSSEEAAKLNLSKYEELKKLQESPKSVESEDIGESMEIVPEKRIEELEQELEKKCKTIEERRQVIDNLTVERDALARKSVDLELQINECKTRYNNMHSKLNNAESNLAAVMSRNTSLMEQLWEKLKKEEAKQTVDDLQQQVKEIAVEKESLENAIKELGEKNTQLAEDYSGMESKVQKIVNKLQNYKHKLAEAETQVEKSSSDYGSWRNDYQDFEQEKKSYVDEINSLKMAVEARDTEFSNYRSYSEERIQELHTELKSLSETGKKQQVHIEQLLLEKESVDKKVQELSEQILLKEQEHQSFETRKEEEINQLKVQLSKVADDLDCQVSCISDLKNDHNLAVGKIAELTQCLDVRDAELLNVKNANQEEMEKLRSKLEEEVGEKQNIIDQNSSLMSQLEKLLEQEAELKARLKENQDKTQQCHTVNTQLQNENAAYVMEANNCRNMMKGLKEEKNQLNEKVKELERYQQKYLNEREKIESSTLQDKEILVTLSKENTFLRTCVQENEKDLKEFSAQKSHFKKVIEELETKKKELKEKLESLAEAMEAKNSACEKNLGEAAIRVAELQASKEAEINRLNSQKEALQAELVVLRNEEQKVSTESRTLLPEAVRREVDSLRIEIVRLKGEKETLTEQIESLRVEHESLISRLGNSANNNTQINTLQTTILQLQNEKVELIRNNEALQRERELSNNQLVSEILNRYGRNARRPLEGDNSPVQDPECDSQNDPELTQLKAEKEELRQTVIILETENERLRLLTNAVSAASEKQKQDCDEMSRLCAKTKEESTQQVLELENKLSAVEAEKESLIEKVEDLERNLRSLHESKELAEKEYYMCIQQKEKIIEGLENEISDLKNSARHAGEASSSEVGVGEEPQKRIVDLNQKNEALHKENEALQHEVKSSRAENEKWKREMEMMNNEMRTLSESITHANSQRDRVIKEHQQQLERSKMKYERAKEIIEKIEMDKKELENELKECYEKLESYKSKADAREAQEANIWEELQTSKRKNHDLWEQLRQTREGLVPLQAKVKELESVNCKIQKENRELSEQLQLADKHLQKLKRQTEDVKSRRFSVSHPLRSPALDSVLERRTRDLKKETVKNGNPILIRKNTSKNVTETYIVHKSSSPEPVGGSLNGSIASDGFSNRSAMGTSYFQCDDEEEFLNHRSLSHLKPCTSTTTSTPARRMNELQKRNSLCPPHMRSSYPVETQMLSTAKYTDDSIKDNVDQQNKLKKESKYSRLLQSKRKRDESSVSSEREPKKSAKPNVVEVKENATAGASTLRSRNPFPSPSRHNYAMFSFKTPTSMKKLLAAQKRLDLLPKASKGAIETFRSTFNFS